MDTTKKVKRISTPVHQHRRINLNVKKIVLNDFDLIQNVYTHSCEFSVATKKNMNFFFNFMSNSILSHLDTCKKG
jgi:hypothetical protein